MKTCSIGGMMVLAAMVAFSAPTAAYAASNDQPYIYATSWGITLAEDGTGFYTELARFLLGPKEAFMRYRVSPYRRAMRSFLEDRGSCVYPKSVDALYRTGDWHDDDRLIESGGMIRSPIHIFTPEGKPVVHKDEDLIGKRVAYAMGSKIPFSVRVKGVNFIPIADEVDKAKLLRTGTVDAIVANLPDALFVFKSLKEPLPAYDPDYDPVPIPVIRIVCHDTPANRAFIHAFNAKVTKAVESGEMAKFLNAHQLKADKYLPR